MLTRYPNWFCDGTFDSAPVGYQLYTIHALLNETVTIPLVFCISKSKTEVVYKEIFSTLKENFPMLNPATIMFDYERAAINAFTQVFPNAEIKDASGEPTINYTSSFNVIAYIDSKHYIK